jgi:hypothetical protein
MMLFAIQASGLKWGRRLEGQKNLVHPVILSKDYALVSKALWARMFNQLHEHSRSDDLNNQDRIFKISDGLAASWSAPEFRSSSSVP